MQKTDDYVELWARHGVHVEPVRTYDEMVAQIQRDFHVHVESTPPPPPETEADQRPA